MADTIQLTPSELRDAFAVYERQVRINNYKVGCVLALIFMPAGGSLDYFVYHEHLPAFFKLRLLCSGLLALILFLFPTRIGIPVYPFPCFLVAFLPLSF